MPRPGQGEPQSPSKRSPSHYARWIFVGWVVIVAVWALQPWRSTTDPAPPPAPTREQIAAIEQRAAERKERRLRKEAAKIEWVRNLQSFRDCDACPEMVVIPAASFVIGRRKRDDWDDVRNNEYPPRQVTVQSFIVARHQVSLDEWASCVDDGGCTYRPDPHKPPYPEAGEGTQPVTGVSWNDAQDYVRWFGRQTGKNYRLPTEAEWASAARVGITAPFGYYYDKDLDPNSTKDNAWEWVQDCYRNSYADLPTDGSAYEMPDCKFRVVRGGWWTTDSGYNVGMKRLGWEPSIQSRFNGFRVARTP